MTDQLVEIEQQMVTALDRDDHDSYDELSAEWDATWSRRERDKTSKPSAPAAMRTAQAEVETLAVQRDALRSQLAADGIPADDQPLAYAEAQRLDKQITEREWRVQFAGLANEDVEARLEDAAVRAEELFDAHRETLSSAGEGSARAARALRALEEAEEGKVLLNLEAKSRRADAERDAMYDFMAGRQALEELSSARVAELQQELADLEATRGSLVLGDPRPRAEQWEIEKVRSEIAKVKSETWKPSESTLMRAMATIRERDFPDRENQPLYPRPEADASPSDVDLRSLSTRELEAEYERVVVQKQARELQAEAYLRGEVRTP